MNPTPILSALLAAVVGGFAGFFAGHSSAPAASPEATGSDPQLAAMLAELRTLRTELSARSPATAAPTQPDAQRTAIERPATHDETLLAELRGLRARVDQIGTMRAAENGMLRQLVTSRVRDERGLTTLARLRDDNFDAAQQQAFLLSVADVLQRYGKPDRANVTSSGMRWEYEFGDGDDGHWLGLTFVDGVVVRVE